MTAKEFNLLTRMERYEALRKNGEFVVSRFFSSYNVHLYLLGDLKVEVWQRLGFRTIDYIEILTNKDALQEYMDNLDLDSDFDLGLGG